MNYGYTDHVKLTGAFRKHGKIAKVTFRWTTDQPDCPDGGVKMRGRVHRR